MFVDIKIALFLSIILFVSSIVFFINKLIKSSKHQLFGGLINKINTTEKVVALTYDDGPNPPYTQELLNILENLQAKATFFVVGKNVEQYPEIVKDILSKGHELGNHSYSHSAMIFKRPSVIRNEIKRTDRLLHKFGAKSNIHFRVPYGYKFIILPLILKRMQKKNILWNLDPKDYAASDSETIENYVIEHIQPGSIILMHDGGGDRSLTLTATENLIIKLRQQGYEFKTVSDLIELK
jgi:peptidoglycan/xylan/chitin deacetylase (PgdA/CDA1 family)